MFFFGRQGYLDKLGTITRSTLLNEKWIIFVVTWSIGKFVSSDVGSSWNKSVAAEVTGMHVHACGNILICQTTRIVSTGESLQPSLPTLFGSVAAWFRARIGTSHACQYTDFFARMYSANIPLYEWSSQQLVDCKFFSNSEPDPNTYAADLIGKRVVSTTKMGFFNALRKRGSFHFLRFVITSFFKRAFLTRLRPASAPRKHLFRWHFCSLKIDGTLEGWLDKKSYCSRCSLMTLVWLFPKHLLSYAGGFWCSKIPAVLLFLPSFLIRSVILMT